METKTGLIIAGSGCAVLSGLIVVGIVALGIYLAMALEKPSVRVMEPPVPLEEPLMKL